MEDQSPQTGLRTTIVDLQEKKHDYNSPESKRKSQASFALRKMNSPSNTQSSAVSHSRPAAMKLPPPKPSRKPSLRLEPLQFGLFNPVTRNPRKDEGMDRFEASSNSNSKGALGVTRKVERDPSAANDPKDALKSHRSFTEMEQDLRSGVALDKNQELIARNFPRASHILDISQKTIPLVKELQAPIGQILHPRGEQTILEQRKHIPALVSQNRTHENLHHLATRDSYSSSKFITSKPAVSKQSKPLFLKHPASEPSSIEFENKLRTVSKPIKRNTFVPVPVKPPKPVIGEFEKPMTDKVTNSLPTQTRVQSPNKPIKKNIKDSISPNIPAETHGSLLPKSLPPIKPAKVKAQQNIQMEQVFDEKLIPSTSVGKLVPPPKPSKPAIIKPTQGRKHLPEEAASKRALLRSVHSAKPSKPLIENFNRSEENFLKDAASKLTSAKFRAYKSTADPSAASSEAILTGNAIASPARPSKKSASVQMRLDHKIELSANRDRDSTRKQVPAHNFHNHLSDLLRSSTAPVTRSHPAVNVAIRSSTSVEEPKSSIQPTLKPRSKGPRRRLPKKFV